MARTSQAVISRPFFLGLMVVTLTANVVLAVLFLKGRPDRLAAAPVAPGKPNQPSVETQAPLSRESKLEELPAGKVEEGLTWDKLKSKDVRQLVANLRQVEVPEYVIEYLAQEVWEERAKSVVPKMAKADFWLIGEQAMRAAEQRERLRDQISAESRSVLKDLFGYVPDKELKQDLVTQPEILLVFGFIPDPSLQNVLSEFKFIVETDQKSEERMAKGFELQTRIQFYRKIMEMASIQLSPGDVEEGRLRVCMFLLISFSNEITSLDLSGYQARELLRRIFQKTDPIEELLQLDGKVGQFLEISPASMTGLISPAQILKIQRLADPELDRAFVFGEKENLSAEKTLQLHEITKLAKSEMEGATEKYLLEENRQKELAAIKKLTRDAVRKIIPANSIQSFEENFQDFTEGAP